MRANMRGGAMTHKSFAAAAALYASLSLLSAQGAAAAEPSSRQETPRLDKVNFAEFACADALKLKDADPPRYGEAAQWLAGWLAESKVAMTVSLPAIAQAADKWAADCAASPAARLKDVAKRPPGEEAAFDLSALKCQEFLELNEGDAKTALALIRWLDGYNAAALRETKANFYYHKKHLQSAVDGCMKYPRSVLSKVTAGKYR